MGALLTVELVAITLDITGAGVGYTNLVGGFLELVGYTKPSAPSPPELDEIPDVITVLVTTETSGKTLWSQASVGASAVVRPRATQHNTLGVEYEAADGLPILSPILIEGERVKVAVTGGSPGSIETFRVVVVL